MKMTGGTCIILAVLITVSGSHRLQCKDNLKMSTEISNKNQSNKQRKYTLKMIVIGKL